MYVLKIPNSTFVENKNANREITTEIIFKDWVYEAASTLNSMFKKAIGIY